MSKVAIVKTTPATVLEDYHRLMNLAGYQQVVAKDAETALKVNISWHFFYPAASTTPWQLEGVIRAMKRDGYDPGRIHACHNRTVVIDARLGERENKQINVVEAHGLANVHLYDDGIEWIDIRDAVGDLADDFLCLNQVYPKGFRIPKRFLGENIIHLPTVKTHVFTTMTGAMKNAFGGLLNEHRHWTHPVIHETLVDLLMIQKRIHRGVFAVMDGTFAGDGPGPRCMIPHVKNVLLASADQVAIDAVAARLMGFDPLEIKFIRLAHERGLGCGDVSEIEIAGSDVPDIRTAGRAVRGIPNAGGGERDIAIAGIAARKIDIVGDAEAARENWGFEGPFRKMTFAARMQHMIYWGRMKRFVEWSLRTWLAPWAYIASVLYHDTFWYPLWGRVRVQKAMRSPWGRLFHNWERVMPDARGYPTVGESTGKLVRNAWRLLGMSLSILATCIREAPEFALRKRTPSPLPRERVG